MVNIESIVKHAKETLLKDGEHPPTLFVEYEGGGASDILLFADFPFSTTLQRKIALFSVGREQGIAHPGENVTHVCFVIEAWASVLKEGEKARYSPSQDPQRKEILMVLMLSVGDHSLSETMQHLEMLRDGSGKLIDLLTDGETHEVHGAFLSSFLAGYVSAKMSDEALERMIEGLVE